MTHGSWSKWAPSSMGPVEWKNGWEKGKISWLQELGKDAVRLWVRVSFYELRLEQGFGGFQF
jgi:hypothetical protein